MHKLKYLTISIILVMSLSLAGLSFNVFARPLAATSPTLGAADSFAVLAGTAITNVPTSAITGDVGLSPAAGSNYAGLTAAEVTGTIYAVDATGPAGSVNNPALLTTAKTDLVTAYDGLASQGCDTTYPGVKDLVGLTLVPGVYCADAFTLSGTLTLNGSIFDVWVFKSAATLITSGTANVTLSSGGDPCYVWWWVASSATLGTGTSLAGNILALTSISLATGANLDGRALARNGAVTMDQNTITRPVCLVAPTNTPTNTPTSMPTPVVLPDTGFAPQHGTVLSAQPAEKAYADLGDLWLEIPRLGVQLPIVGVPQTDGEWDVSWLGNQAGWLNGTAFPTWAGNSALTGHVYDAYGNSGPFVHLNWLWWGDKVIVHAWGAQYVYEVRQVTQVEPGATSSVIKHEELPWVTLITCRGYDEASNSYKYRVVVRAVLVEVK